MKLTLLIAPGQRYNTEISNRLVAHLNPDTYDIDYSANYVDITIPGLKQNLQQFVSGSDYAVSLALIFNELGANEEDFSVQVGHQSVKKSVEWLIKVQEAVGQTTRAFTPGIAPPLLLFFYGRNQAVLCTLRGLKVNILKTDLITGFPLRARCSFTLKRYIKSAI